MESLKRLTVFASTPDGMRQLFSAFILMAFVSATMKFITLIAYFQASIVWAVFLSTSSTAIAFSILVTAFFGLIKFKMNQTN